MTARIARAARAFGYLRRPVFKCKDLISHKGAVYRAVVLVLLYKAEFCTVKTVYTRHLSLLYNSYIWPILGVMRYQQWNESKHQLGYHLSLEFSM